MDTRVHPMLALTVVAVSAIAVGLWIVGSAGARAVPGMDRIAADPAGRVHIQVGGLLLEHDGDGRFVRRHDLRQLGVGALLGQVAFFSDGTLLLRSGADRRGFGDRLRAFLRQENRRTMRPAAAGDGLQRCNLATLSCTPFGTPALDPGAAFSLYVDPHSDDVFLSDTSRHRLLKFSADGRPLAESGPWFRFPNRLTRYEGRLYVADTNHHAIAVVNPAAEPFGEQEDTISIVPAVAERAGRRWPTDIAQIGEQWWVNIRRGDLTGGGIYAFDGNWRYLYPIALPDGAEAGAMVRSGADVLVLDTAGRRIVRLNAAGQLLEPFDSGEIRAALEATAAERGRHVRLAYAGIALFAGVLLGLLGYGLRRAPGGEPAGTQPPSAAPATRQRPSGGSVVWLYPQPRMVTRLRLANRVAIVVFVLLAALLAYAMTCYGSIRQLNLIVAVCGGLSVLIGMVAMTIRANVGSAIGVDGENVTLRDHRGNESTCHSAELRFDGTTIATDAQAVFLGQPAMPLFERQELMTSLYPLLARARSVTVWQMLALLIRIRHPQGLVTIAVLVGLAAGVVAVMARHVLRGA